MGGGPATVSARFALEVMDSVLQARLRTRRASPRSGAAQKLESQGFAG